MKRVLRFVPMVVVLLLCVLMVACSNNGSAAANPVAPGANNAAASNDSGGEARTDVVYCLISDIGSFDPTFTTDQISIIPWRQLYDTLVVKNADATYSPKLAESWEISEDGKTYTFHLRKDVVCHDGLPMTAEDVAYSLNHAIQSAALKAMMVSMREATVVDDYTVQLNMDAPYAPTLEVLSGIARIFCARTVNFDELPIGTGPYKFVSRSSGENIILEGWDQYYLGEPRIKNLTFKIISDSTTQIAALQMGEVDFLTHAPLVSKDTVLSDSSLVWQETKFRGLTWVIFRNTVAPFDNVLARKAVQYALNKDAMLVGGSEGLGKIQNTNWPTDLTASPENVYTPSYTYDLDKAKEYFEQYKQEAGVSSVKVSILAPDSVMYLNPAMTLEGMMREVGFDVTVEQIDRATFWSSLFSGNYQIAVAGNSYPCGDGDANYMFLHSSQVGGQNYGPVVNDRIDELMAAARLSSDTAARTDMYAQVQGIIDEEAYFVPLYQFANAVVFNANLKGVDLKNNLYQHYVYDWSW